MGIASRLNEKYGPRGTGMKPEERKAMALLASWEPTPGPAPDFALDNPPKKPAKPRTKKAK